MKGASKQISVDLKALFYSHLSTCFLCSYDEVMEKGISGSQTVKALTKLLYQTSRPYSDEHFANTCLRIFSPVAFPPACPLRLEMFTRVFSLARATYRAT